MFLKEIYTKIEKMNKQFQNIRRGVEDVFLTKENYENWLRGRQ